MRLPHVVLSVHLRGFLPVLRPLELVPHRGEVPSSARWYIPERLDRWRLW